MWTHTDDLEHGEKCESCGADLELRLVGNDTWVFYCRDCLKHKIVKPQLGKTKK